jgi:hypothetical protein
MKVAFFSYVDNPYITSGSRASGVQYGNIPAMGGVESVEMNLLQNAM